MSSIVSERSTLFSGGNDLLFEDVSEGGGGMGVVGEVSSNDELHLANQQYFILNK